MSSTRAVFETILIPRVSHFLEHYQSMQAPTLALFSLDEIGCNALRRHNALSTFLISKLLLTLISMLIGVLGKASKTSFSNGIRLSFPSHWHAEKARFLNVFLKDNLQFFDD